MTRKAKFYMYRNLHTGGFSIKQHGLVYDRGDLFTMDNVEFCVSKPSSKRAKDKHQRNVHAYMVADNYKLHKKGKSIDSVSEVTYNPFKYKQFIRAKTRKPITKAKYAIAVNGKVYVK